MHSYRPAGSLAYGMRDMISPLGHVGCIAQFTVGLQSINLHVLSLGLTSRVNRQ